MYFDKTARLETTKQTLFCRLLLTWLHDDQNGKHGSERLECVVLSYNWQGVGGWLHLSVVKRIIFHEVIHDGMVRLLHRPAKPQAGLQLDGIWQVKAGHAGFLARDHITVFVQQLVHTVNPKFPDLQPEGQRLISTTKSWCWHTVCITGPLCPESTTGDLRASNTELWCVFCTLTISQVISEMRRRNAYVTSH